MAIGDGSANAPVGSPQVPNLFSGEMVRPSWSVAGVDYAVGTPSNVTLKDPSTISMAGVTLDKANHLVTVTGSNVTLDGYDFSLNGGWGVVVQGANTKILDSNFLVGANSIKPVFATVPSSNLTIAYCTIDGHNDGNINSLIEDRGSGTMTVQYSWLKNAGGDMIQMHNNDQPAGLVAQYNLIQNAGMSAGSHGDYTEFSGGPYTATITYNTTTQHGGSTQGFMIEPDHPEGPGVITSGEIGNNTFTGSVNAFTAVTVADIVNTFTVHDNYFDPTQTTFGQGLAFGGVRGGPDDGNPKSIYIHNVNITNGSILQDSNAPASTPASPPSSTAPSAPVIASFSTDSGVVGDRITNDNTLTLTGTAAASSIVKVFDGTTEIGKTTANSAGSWDYITSVLTDAKHTLTATATNSSGQSSPASSALAVTVDTAAPSAPIIASSAPAGTNMVLLKGTAETKSSVQVFDGTTKIGTVSADTTGAWNLTTGTLTAGSHSFTTKAVDAAGNLSPASAPASSTIAQPATTAPAISTLSSDSGKIGDGITNDNTPTLSGTAAVNSTVKVYDGTSQIGTVTADANGAWHFNATTLSDGSHSFAAKETDASGQAGPASSVLAVTIDTHAPAAPTMTAYTPDGKAISGPTAAHELVLKGTAEATSTINVFDGGKQIGTATADSTGSWSFDTAHVSCGSHSFTSNALDVAGNASVASVADVVTVGARASAVGHSNVHGSGDHQLANKGTVDAYSHAKVFEDNTAVETPSANAAGTWHLSAPSGASHAMQADRIGESDSTGLIRSGNAILCSKGGDALSGASGNDFPDHGGHDTFVFAPNFGHDVVKDFAASGRSQDAIQFSKSAFDSFADVLAHAAQSGHDVIISDGADGSLTLKHVGMGAHDRSDFHFA